MEHKCLKAIPVFGSNSAGWIHDEEPCTCECMYCDEYRRTQSLVPIKEVELEQLERLMESITPGPWEDTQIKGFGAMNFLITMSEQSQPKWHRVVAILENASFDTGRFMAWCRDGVPRLIRMIRTLQKENAELKKKLGL